MRFSLACDITLTVHYGSESGTWLFLSSNPARYRIIAVDHDRMTNISIRLFLPQRNFDQLVKYSLSALLSIEILPFHRIFQLLNFAS
jgi:hypothetical protein